MKHTQATLRAFIGRADTWDKYGQACKYIRGLKGRTGIERDALEIELDRQKEFLLSLED